MNIAAVSMADLPAPAIVLVVAGMLALVLRWVFRPAGLRPEPPVDATEAADLGLLTVVASGVSRADAMAERALLGEAGIRSSMSLRRDGSMDVLVFHADATRARRLLSH